MKGLRKCAKCGELKGHRSFRKRHHICKKCFSEIKRKGRESYLEKERERFEKRELVKLEYLEKQARLKQWRDGLDIEEQMLFDRLRKDERVEIICGAHSILCNGLHWIPDIPPSIADKDDLKIDEEWLSERGKANLHRIKWSNTPLEVKKSVNENLEDEENESEEDEDEREDEEREDNERIDEEFFF
jgi:hypothetical protein